jgi:N-acetylmuramoyl-L-alanine amidase CwlA
MSYTEYQKRWSDTDFAQHIKSLDTSWADSVTIHHTAYPDLAMRPNGLTAKHMQYLMEYYRDEKGWSAGPHLFIDDIAIMGMSPMTKRGVHARSFNSHSIGIEMLGNFDSDSPFDGRGSRSVKRTAKAVAAILDAKGLEPSAKTILFHRDDPKTSKTCPGKLITKAWFVDLVIQNMPGESFPVDSDKKPATLASRVERIENHLGLPPL